MTRLLVVTVIAAVLAASVPFELQRRRHGFTDLLTQRFFDSIIPDAD
jgi:hypothetical protein